SGLQLVLKFGIVVDLPVLHHPVAPRLVGQRLGSSVEVDDRQAGVHHSERTVRIEAYAVRSAVSQLTGHIEQEFYPCLGAASAVVTRYAAHLSPSSSAGISIVYTHDLKCRSATGGIGSCQA